MKVRIHNNNFTFEIYKTDENGQQILHDGVRDLSAEEERVVKEAMFICVQNGMLVEDKKAAAELEKAQQRYSKSEEIKRLKKYLQDTDYVPIKMIEAYGESGESGLEEFFSKYNNILQERKNVRTKINTLA